MDSLKSKIRSVPDFPKAGILFYDITTLLRDREGFKLTIESLVKPFEGKNIEMVVGVESRGFILGGAVADRLGTGFAPVRKKGKLPSTTVRETYDLEYGTDCLEIHSDAVEPGQRVLIIDDVLATGGRRPPRRLSCASWEGRCSRRAFLVELEFLNGRSKLGNRVDLQRSQDIIMTPLVVGAASGPRAVAHRRSDPAEAARGDHSAIAGDVRAAAAATLQESQTVARVVSARAGRAEAVSRRVQSVDEAPVEVSVHQGSVEGCARSMQSEWLVWERAHDAEYALKVAEVQHGIDRAQGQASTAAAHAARGSRAAEARTLPSTHEETSRREGARRIRE